MGVMDSLRDKVEEAVSQVGGNASGASGLASFEELELSFSGMRGTSGYSARRSGDVVDIAFYTLRYRNDEDVKDIEAQVGVPYEEFLDKLNECGASKWDGFEGKHPRGVLDGEQFRLSILVDESRQIKAHGSANFPKGLMDLRRWLDEQLRG